MNSMVASNKSFKQSKIKALHPKTNKPLDTNPQVCKMPDKNTANCVANTLQKTGCVKCSLDNCDKNHTISAACYKDVIHTHDKQNYKMHDTMHNSMHNNTFGSLHNSLNNSIYNGMQMSPETNISGNLIATDFDSNNLEMTNNISNLYKQPDILQQNITPCSCQYNNADQLQYIYNNGRDSNPYAQGYTPNSTGLERALDGSFVKYSRLG